MPNNFRHIGLIHLILPNSKIIDARRRPTGGCFSGFKQLFANGPTFTYGLEDIGKYYRDYVRLMDHWDAVLPGRVHRVQYEDMVSDTEAQIRALLHCCKLDFEEQCLRFYETTGRTHAQFRTGSQADLQTGNGSVASLRITPGPTQESPWSGNPHQVFHRPIGWVTRYPHVFFWLV
jgi:hypothetical protein